MTFGATSWSIINHRLFIYKQVNTSKNHIKIKIATPLSAKHLQNFTNNAQKNNICGTNLAQCGDKKKN